MSLQTGEKFLHEIVSTVSSSLELTEVLRAVVRLMSEASGVHACFAYLVEDDGSRLVLRAASPPYERQAGKVVMERGEGLPRARGRAFPVVARPAGHWPRG